MPYIKTEQRREIDEAIDRLKTNMMLTTVSQEEMVGILNYTITRLLQTVVHSEHPRYHQINSAIGVLECVKQEFYRRLAAPYEVIKCAENGDVDTFSPDAK